MEELGKGRSAVSKVVGRRFFVVTNLLTAAEFASSNAEQIVEIGKTVRTVKDRVFPQGAGVLQVVVQHFLVRDQRDTLNSLGAEAHGDASLARKGFESGHVVFVRIAEQELIDGTGAGRNLGSQALQRRQ